MRIDDVRQTDNWSDYLKMHGWKSLKLENGAVIRLNSFLLSFNMAKLYRPRVLGSIELEEIDKICKENRVLFVKISPIPGQDEDLFKKFGYRRAFMLDLPSKTMFIDLNKDLGELWKSLRSGCKYSIRRSGREGDRVEFIQNPSNVDVEKYYAVVSKRAQKKNFFCPPLEDQQEKVKAFGNEAYILNVYNKEGEILGTKLFLGSKKTILYVHGGTTDVGQKSKGGYKLVWDSIEYFKKNGYELMDLEGLYDSRFKHQIRNWKGYTRFKEHFNGDIVEFPVPQVKYFNVFCSAQ